MMHSQSVLYVGHCQLDTVNTVDTVNTANIRSVSLLLSLLLPEIVDFHRGRPNIRMCGDRSNNSEYTTLSLFAMLHWQWCRLTGLRTSG